MKEISIEISHDCPLECKYCSSSAKHPSPLGELKIEEIKRVLSDSKDLGANKFSISGGEPLLYPKIFDLLKYAHQLDFEILLYTSGMIFDEKENREHISVDLWKKIKSITNNKIRIIFDIQSHKSEIVDYLMNFEGAFENIKKSIRNAVNCGINCEAHVSPMKLNYNDLPLIADFAEKMGLKKLSLLRFVPQGRGAENVEELLLSPLEFVELQRIMLKLVNEFREGKRKIEPRLGHPINFLFLYDTDCEITPCRGGTDAPLVLPNGDVHMCPAWKDIEHLKAGNIRNSSFEDTWNSSKFFKEFREFVQNPDKIIGKCKECKYLLECKAGCTAQRILKWGINMKFPECMFQSPDPLCPILTDQL